MRIIRDYTCDLCGTAAEHFSDSERPLEADTYPCPLCVCGDDAEQFGRMRAHLSPTPTTFKFADGSATKRRRVQP